MIRYLICALFLTAACGDNDRPLSGDRCGYGLEPYAGEPSAPTTATFWMQHDPDLSDEDILAACDMWAPKGLLCEIAATEQAAKVTIVPDHGECPAHKGGGYILAEAYASLPKGKMWIKVYVECLRDLYVHDEDDHLSRQATKLVLGHEIGHESGIWDHVPLSCDESKATSQAEIDMMRQGICGPSLMNPVMDPNVCFITDHDARAYDRRDTTGNFLTEETPHGCTLSVAGPS
jgi:hypothetical protein